MSFCRVVKYHLLMYAPARARQRKAHKIKTRGGKLDRGKHTRQTEEVTPNPANPQMNTIQLP